MTNLSETDPGRGTSESHGLFSLDPGTVRCPYPLFDHWRTTSPVVWQEEIEAYVVTRYEDIANVLRQPELYSSQLATGPVLARQLQEALGRLTENDRHVEEALAAQAGRGTTQVLLTADPPDHSRQRALVNRAFTPAAVKRHESVIRDIANALVDEFMEQAEVDLVESFAVPLPLTVIAQLLGVPTERAADFKRWSDDFVVAIGNHNLTAEQTRRMVLSQAEFFDYFAQQIDDRRENPRQDMVSDIVAARIDGEELSTPEMLAMFSQFLVAGNETTTKLIATSLLWLCGHPDVTSRLRDDSTAVRAFVDEMVRLESPVQGMFRVAREDSVIGETAVPAGSALWLVYASANRDGEVFAEPDRCSLDRKANRPHLGFGLGEHFCLGAALARAEARIGIEVLLSRCGTPELAVPDSDLRYEPSYALHGLQHLPLRWVR